MFYNGLPVLWIKTPLGIHFLGPSGGGKNIGPILFTLDFSLRPAYCWPLNSVPDLLPLNLTVGARCFNQQYFHSITGPASSLHDYSLLLLLRAAAAATDDIIYFSGEAPHIDISVERLRTLVFQWRGLTHWTCKHTPHWWNHWSSCLAWWFYIMSRLCLSWRMKYSRCVQKS